MVVHYLDNDTAELTDVHVSHNIHISGTFGGDNVTTNNIDAKKGK